MGLFHSRMERPRGRGFRRDRNRRHEDQAQLAARAPAAQRLRARTSISGCCPTPTAASRSSPCRDELAPRSVGGDRPGRTNAVGPGSAVAFRPHPRCPDRGARQDACGVGGRLERGPGLPRPGQPTRPSVPAEGCRCRFVEAVSLSFKGKVRTNFSRHTKAAYQNDRVFVSDGLAASPLGVGLERAAQPSERPRWASPSPSTSERSGARRAEAAGAGAALPIRSRAGSSAPAERRRS